MKVTKITFLVVISRTGRTGGIEGPLSPIPQIFKNLINRRIDKRSRSNSDGPSSFLYFPTTLQLQSNYIRVMYPKDFLGYILLHFFDSCYHLL